MTWFFTLVGIYASTSALLRLIDRIERHEGG